MLPKWKSSSGEEAAGDEKAHVENAINNETAVSSNLELTESDFVILLIFITFFLSENQIKKNVYGIPQTLTFGF